MKKKAQLDQPFIYILAIITIAFIVLFGFRYIGKTQEFTEKAQYVQFQSELKTAVYQVHSKNPDSLTTYSFQSSNKPLSVPEGIKGICFQDLGVKTKVIPDNSYYETFTINDLSPAAEDLCIKTPSIFAFKLENKIINKETVVVISNI